MRKNVGNLDRTVRILLGLVLIGAGTFGSSGYWTIVLWFFGLLLIVTGAIGWCALYSLLGFSSKGEGIDRISKRDIERAVKSQSTQSEPLERIEASAPAKTSAAKKSATKKTVAKKTTKKAASKKTAVKKTSTKKSAKKAATKKKTTKKTAQ